jgi:hypothetical protein
MGFWQGINRGFAAVQEEKTRKRERQEELDLRKAERDEERAYREGLESQNFIRQQSLATIPLLVERKREEAATATQRAQLGKYFGDRLTDLPEETRQAFTNLAIQDSAYSEALRGTIERVEGDLGRRVTGADILKMTNLIEKTKPENVSIEDWTKQAASMTVTSGSNIDYETTLEKLFSGDVTLEDIQKTQMEIMMPTASSLNLIPDIDTSVVMGSDPQVSIQLRNLAVTTMQDQFQADRAATDQQYKTATDQGVMPDQALETKNMELGRIAALEGEEKEAALFNYYAPTLLPKLAEREPRFKSVFPEYFQSTAQVEVQPTITYEFVDGKLVVVTR